MVLKKERQKEKRPITNEHHLEHKFSGEKKLPYVLSSWFNKDKQLE